MAERLRGKAVAAIKVTSRVQAIEKRAGWVVVKTTNRCYLIKNSWVIRP